ncbi:tetratricopeptide repeat protein, partial [Mycobacterium tuberculosis]|nr:tetratricopeptide repeat protein [Mycobacterium tuberculosis]
VPMIVVQSDGDELVAQLLKQRERGRRTVEATVQLASVAIAQGRTELGEQLYREALKDAPVQGSLGRSVRWNYGWDLLRQGQPEAALEQW